MAYHLYKADDGKHKFMVITPDEKKIKFGAIGYEDYTTHKDKERMERYLLRHKKEDWNNKNSKGYWSRWLLWSEPSLTAAIRNTKKRFNIKIISHF